MFIVSLVERDIGHLSCCESLRLEIYPIGCNLAHKSNILLLFFPSGATVTEFSFCICDNIAAFYYLLLGYD